MFSGTGTCPRIAYVMQFDFSCLQGRWKLVKSSSNEMNERLSKINNLFGRLKDDRKRNLLSVVANVLLISFIKSCGAGDVASLKK